MFGSRIANGMKRALFVVGFLALTLACGGVEGEPPCPTLGEAGGLRLVYAVEGDAAAVQQAMEQRLDGVGLRCAAARVEGSDLVVEIVGPADPAAIGALSVTGRLSIRPTLPGPQAVGVMVGMRPPSPIEMERDGSASLAGPDAASFLRAWVSEHELPDDVVALYEQGAGEARAYLVRDDEGLLDATVAEVDQRDDRSLLVTLSPKDQRTLAALSTQHVKDALVIAVDDEVVSAPKLQEPLPADQPFVLSSPDPDGLDELALTLRAGSLPEPVTLMSEELVGAASSP